MGGHLGESIRYGVIGTGMMGVEHIENLNRLDVAVVTAICDPDAASRDRGRTAVGGDVAVFETHEALLAAGLCDAVVIATPNHTHVRIVLDCLAAGVHLLIEKPLCTTVEDCMEVVAAVAAAPEAQVVQVGLEYRYMPPTRALLDEVRSGAVGAVRMVAIREHRFAFLSKVGDWNRFNRFTGGTFVEKCCHFFDLMNLIIGERPEWVMASGGQDVNHLDERYLGEQPDIFDNGFVIVEYPGGRRAMLDLCMFAEASRNEQEISVVGDLGKVEALVTEGIVRVGRRSDRSISERSVEGRDVAHVGMHHGASYLEHVAFARSISMGTAPEVTVEDGLIAVAMGVAAHRSVLMRRPVSLEEVLA
jgi:predicted dehydrogenase